MQCARSFGETHSSWLGRDPSGATMESEKKLCGSPGEGGSQEGEDKLDRGNIIVTNFIQTYLHEYWVFFDNLSCIGKPSRRPFQ